MSPYLVIFLSENWADLVKQPVPAIWKDLTPEQKCDAIEAYAERVTRRFKDAGVDLSLFEIGNEIDFGLCGIFEEEWPKRVSREYMTQQIWSKMTPNLLAAQRGVKKVVPEARFVIHLARWNELADCIAQWQCFLNAGVQIDYAGLSYFPSSVAKREQTPIAFLKEQAKAIRAAIHRPVLICETAFPCEAHFDGQFADWNKPVTGHTLDAAGQRRWIAELLAMARADPNFAGVFYWSPEWFGPGMWRAFALFDEQGRARPALTSFEASPATQPTTKPNDVRVYLGNLHAHTALSDGTGTPEEAYAFARDVAKLDFLAITEHNHLLGGDTATIEARRQLYAKLPAAAKQFDEPGRFVTLYGQEFSSMSKGNHVNVFDVEEVIDVPNGDFAGLLRWMDAHPDSSGRRAVLQWNHPALGPPGKGIPANEYGRDDFTDDAGWLSHMDAATSLIEVLNGEADPSDTTRRAPQVMEKHYLAYLQRGFHLAPTGDQDNHKKQWGMTTDVRTGVWATELSRETLLDALRARHTYATEDKNLRLIARLNGHLMGDVIEADTPPDRLALSLDLQDDDEPEASYTIEVLQGAIGGKPAQVVDTIRLASTKAKLELDLAHARLIRDGDFVLLRITQHGDGPADRTWTAPVWLKLRTPVAP
ncbi:MAG: CehA/McbA family metallohydrolase [Tepidisphaeraceae bacterium]